MSEIRKEKISSFEYLEDPLDKGKSITFWMDSELKQFVVTDDFTGKSVTCSTFDLGWLFFSNWVYERCHGPRLEN